MDRRQLITAFGSSAALLAGCSSLSESPSTTQANNSPSQRQTKTPTPQPEPTISWTDYRVSKDSYRVQASIQLNGANGVNIARVDMSETPSETHYLTTITESGTHTIAGPDTETGTLPATLLYVELADGTEDQIEVSSKVGEHIVGTNVSQSNPPQEASEQVLTFLDGLSGSTLPDTSINGFHDRTFVQSYPGGRSEFSLKIPKSQYQYYKDRPRTGDYGSYVSDDIDDSSIQSVASTFEDYGKRNDQTSRQIADHVIAWVQGMKYTQDKPATGYNEYPKYPAETLVDQGGDCEDTSILLASVFEAMGYGTVLLELPDAKHMAVGVSGEDSIQGSYYTYNGTRYYYVETTGSGWRVGEVPNQVKEAGGRANILEINSSPSLAFNWEVSAPDSGGIVVSTAVRNFGDARARTAKVQVDAETRDGTVVAQQRTNLPTIQTDSNVSENLRLSPPSDQTLRLRIGIILDGVLHDVATTDYHSP